VNAAIAEAQPHARVVLGAALASGAASHAYLFHGPPGTGKREAALAFAAELLADGDDSVRSRVLREAHPDLAIVAPTGAHVMRVDDIQPLASVSHTPFEAKKRVFVLERVDTMNDEVANRLLKTLEEPPSYVHLILLTDQLGQVIDTVVSRCQLVRFDPLPAALIASQLDAEPVLAEASARLALGDLGRAKLLASPEGIALRDDVERMVRAALAGQAGESWRALLDRGQEALEARQDEIDEERRRRLEYEPNDRERRALEKEYDESAKRAGRRARTATLDLGLELASITFRDLVCLAEGAREAVLGTDRCDALAAAASGRDPRRLRRAAELCEQVRQSLQLNVSEDLALTALTLRLARLVGPG